MRKKLSPYTLRERNTLRNAYLKAFFVYWFLTSSLILSVSSLEGGVAEHVARNWLMALVVLSVNSAMIPFRSTTFFLVRMILLGVTFFIQIYIAYSVKDYDPTGHIDGFYLVCSIVFYMVAGGLFLIIARAVYPEYNKSPSDMLIDRA